MRSERINNLYKEKQKAKDNQEQSKVKGITKAIRRQYARERADLRIKHLEEKIWFDVKRAKTGFVPTHTKLKHEDGKIATSAERPEVLADFDEKKLWKAPEPQTTQKIALLHTEKANVEEGSITMEELIAVLKKFKNNKALGPDGVPAEFYKWLNADAQEQLLKILNACWNWKHYRRTWKRRT